MAIKLKDIKLFEGIDFDAIEMIIDRSRKTFFSDGDIILKQGDSSDETAYIIQEGEVKVEIDLKEIAILKQGEVFGEIALITDEPRVASVIAITDLIVLKIDKKLLHTIIKKFKNGKDIQKVLMQRILENVQNKG